MWIQTTRDITREEAERKLLDLVINNIIRLKEIPNDVLEDMIEEDFDNYHIIN